MSAEKQHTLAGDVSCDGIGLHSGKPVIMTLKPAPVDTGIVFIRTDLENRPQVHAVATNVTATTQATTLAENGTTVTTIEHIMAAFAILKIDNCYVEMSSAEPPVGDGSAKTFIEAMQKQASRRRTRNGSCIIWIGAFPITKGINI